MGMKETPTVNLNQDMIGGICGFGCFPPRPFTAANRAGRRPTKQ